MPKRTKPRAVLYVANASKLGGGNRVFIDLIQNLDRDRYQPHLVCPEPGPMADWASAVGIQCSISAAGDWYGVSGLARLSRRTIELAMLIRSVGADVVHAAAPMCYRSLGVAGRLAGAARVCHLGFPPEPGELQRAFLSGPEAVVGCYEGQAAEHAPLIRGINPTCRVIGVPNGVDTARFSPGPAAPDVLSLRQGRSLAVAIVGHISDVKGYRAFIDAAADIARRHDVVFFAVGGETTQPGARAQFESRVRELNLQERFHFLGARQDVPDVLRAMDIVCLPSLAEGLPLAILEAMATGAPVVATPVGGVPEAVADGETGFLIPPDDDHALGRALETLLTSPERIRRMGAAARARVELRFSVQTFANRIQDLYGSLTPATPPVLGSERHGGMRTAL